MRRTDRCPFSLWFFTLLVASLPGVALVAQEPGPTNRVPDAKARQDVTWPGMTQSGTVLLPNGWSLKPAGRQTTLGDFPVQIAVHPERAGPGDPPCRLRRARGRDGRRATTGKIDRPGLVARDVRRAGLVGRRQATFTSAAAGTT